MDGWRRRHVPCQVGYELTHEVQTKLLPHANRIRIESKHRMKNRIIESTAIVYGVYGGTCNQQLLVLFE